MKRLVFLFGLFLFFFTTVSAVVVDGLTVNINHTVNPLVNGSEVLIYGFISGGNGFPSSDLSLVVEKDGNPVSLSKPFVYKSHDGFDSFVTSGVFTATLNASTPGSYVVKLLKSSKVLDSKIINVGLSPGFFGYCNIDFVTVTSSGVMGGIGINVSSSGNDSEFIKVFFVNESGEFLLNNGSVDLSTPGFVYYQFSEDWNINSGVRLLRAEVSFNNTTLGVSTFLNPCFTTFNKSLSQTSLASGVISGPSGDTIFSNESVSPTFVVRNTGKLGPLTLELSGLVNQVFSVEGSEESFNFNFSDLTPGQYSLNLVLKYGDLVLDSKSYSLTVLDTINLTVLTTSLSVVENTVTVKNVTLVNNGLKENYSFQLIGDFGKLNLSSGVIDKGDSFNVPVVFSIPDGVAPLSTTLVFRVLLNSSVVLEKVLQLNVLERPLVHGMKLSGFFDKSSYTPGDVGVFVLELSNTGELSEVVSVSYSFLGNSFVSSDSVRVSSGEVVKLPVYFEVPVSVSSDFGLIVSVSNENLSESISKTVKVVSQVFDFSVFSSSIVKGGLGDEKSLNVLVSNTGNQEDSFIVSFSGYPFVGVGNEEFRLVPGEKANLTVKVVFTNSSENSFKIKVCSVLGGECVVKKVVLELLPPQKVSGEGSVVFSLTSSDSQTVNELGSAVFSFSITNNDSVVRSFKPVLEGNLSGLNVVIEPKTVVVPPRSSEDVFVYLSAGEGFKSGSSRSLLVKFLEDGELVNQESIVFSVKKSGKGLSFVVGGLVLLGLVGVGVFMFLRFFYDGGGSGFYKHEEYY